MTANRSASFNEYGRVTAGIQSGEPARRTESLPVNASTRKPNRVDTGVSTSGLREFVKEGKLPPYFAAVLHVHRPSSSLAFHFSANSEKAMVEPAAAVSPVEPNGNPNGNGPFPISMFTRPRQRDVGAAVTVTTVQATKRNGISRTDTVASISPADSRDERVSLSRTSRHSRMSIPRPILKGPGRSVPDVETARITVHAHDKVEEALPQRGDKVLAIESGTFDENPPPATVEELPSTPPPTTSNVRGSEPVPDVEPNFDEEDLMDDDDEWDAELTDLTENVNLLDLGGKLEPFLIAHDREAVIRMNKANIAWGVQYEIARGVSQKSWTWADVTDERLEMLQGSNLEKAPLVIDVFGKGPGTLEAFLQAEKIFGELDREQKAKLENEGRGLGLRGAWEGVEDWYGGRVQQIARLRKVPGVEGYSIMLDRMQHGKSNRVTRFFGSRSLLQIRIEEKLVRSQGAKIMEFLSRRQVVCGRIFYPFFAKENKVYLVECNEDLDRRSRISEGDQYRISWKGFISWHNPLELNRHQPISKWSTRWALVLSTSKPVILFDPRNIFFIDDIYANGYLQGTEKIMTDGCGFINWSACRTIGTAMRLQILPIVFQGRIAGSKGLWLLHPDPKHHDQSEPPMIWIRDSQNKIRLPPLETLDMSHCILDLVRLPRLTLPSTINRQTITNLSANGVPDSAIEKLLEEGLLSEIEPLTNWTGSNFRTHLAKAIENAGRLAGSRRGRQAGLEARAFTYIKDESDDNEDLRDGAFKDGLIDRFAESGCPANLHEVARELLLAGFSPLELSLLRDKLKKIIEEVTRSYVDQYRISVPYSVEAFIVPDPVGVLEEDEIFFRSTERFGDELSIDPTTFTGPVLVMRNPTMVASDIRKVTAVSRDELLSYVNVIVFSTKGSQSLASYLGGGDYDGDTVTILADRSVVDAFSNAKTVREPNNLRDHFQPEIEKVSTFCDRISNMDDATQAYELGKKLLAGLSDSKVGMYSRFHENVVYSRGYSDPEAIRLAYMFTTCLDSTKSGLRLKDDVFEKDQKDYCNPQPGYVVAKDESENSGIRVRPENVRERPPRLGPFILDTLRKKGLELQRDVLARYKSLCNGLAEARDVDLLGPYEHVTDLLKDPENVTRLSFLSDELVVLRQHIQDMFYKYKEEVSALDYRNRGPRINEEGNRGMSRRALVQGIITEFWNSLSGSKLKCSKALIKSKEYMASYAYQFSLRCGVRDRNSIYAKDFAFAVAHSELCSIKAAASKSGRFFATGDAADYLMLHGPLLKASIKAAGN